MSLQVWLPLNGNLDNQGLSNVIVTNNGATVDSSGKIGKCYKLSNYIYNDNFTLLSNGIFSVCYWIKYTSYPTYNEYVICLNDTSSDDMMFSLGIQGNGTANSTGLLSVNASSSGTALSLDTWYHVAYTYDGDKGTLYLNGNKLKDFTPTINKSATHLTINGRYGARPRISDSYVNDIRIYDECLSSREVKEISKGLVLHYPLSDAYIEDTTNLLPQTTNYSTNTSPTWDTSLNGTSLYTPTGWTGGYNSGVPSPTIGYHAHWIFDENRLIMLFPNKNSEVNQKNRWLGICGGVNASTIAAGDKYTVSLEVKTDTLGCGITGGLYYKLTSSSSNAFNDGNKSIAVPTKINVWQTFTYTYTRSSSYDGATPNCNFYFYSNYGAEGNTWVRNVQLQIGDHGTGIIPGGTTENNAIVYDTSGYGYDGTKYGTITYSSGSPRYDGCYYISQSTTINHTNVLNSTNQEWTVSAWIYPTVNTSGQKLNNFNCGNSIYYTTTQPLLYLNSGDNDYYIYGNSNCITLNKWNHIAFVFKNSEGLRKIYINGVDQSAYGPNKTSTPLGIPTTVIIGQNFIGNISDYREYATALSADDIKELYNTPISIDNKGKLLVQGEVIE